MFKSFVSLLRVLKIWNKVFIQKKLFSSYVTSLSAVCVCVYFNDTFSLNNNSNQSHFETLGALRRCIQCLSIYKSSRCNFRWYIMEKMNDEVKCKDQCFQKASSIMTTKLEAQFRKLYLGRPAGLS